jgi:hypothetical protein
MTMGNLIGIDFILDGKRYAVRRWPAVPRVGEVVNLPDPKREQGMRYPALVEHVTWAIREETWAGEQLECEIHISWIPLPGPPHA